MSIVGRVLLLEATASATKTLHATMLAKVIEGPLLQPLLRDIAFREIADHYTILLLLKKFADKCDIEVVRYRRWVERFVIALHRDLAFGRQKYVGLFP